MTVLIKRFKLLILLLHVACLGSTGQLAYAQQATIELGPNRLPINEYFTISLKLRNQPLQTYGDFPEIEGFKKSSRTNTAAQIGIGRKKIIEQTITQNYAAYQEGKFTLKPFTIVVNGKNIASRGTVITIEPMLTEPDEPEIAANPEDPLPRAIPTMPFKTQSFLSVEADRNEVYVGEGFYLRLAFYLAEGEQETLDFYNFGLQFPELVKQLRQKDAWEEAVETSTEIKPDTITIADRIFLKYNLYRRVFYPLNTNPVVFNPVSLNMSRRLVPESYAGPVPTNAVPELITFASKAKRILVKALPPHPLRETVPVGQYRLQEAIERIALKTGQSVTYRFNVVGQGNLGALNPPEILPVAGLEVYPPEIILKRAITAGLVEGTKGFRYVLLAKTAGEYPLNKIFRLVYFNTGTQRYDTLQSAVTLRVSGAAKDIAVHKPETTDPFYKLIQEEENTLVSLNQFDEIKFYSNVVILFLICVSLFLFYKKK